MVPGDAFEVVVPVVGDVVVIVIGGGRAGSAFVGGKRVVVSPWGRWRRRVRSSCRRWEAGSSILLPEHFQRFPLGLRLCRGRGVNTWRADDEAAQFLSVDVLTEPMLDFAFAAPSPSTLPLDGGGEASWRRAEKWAVAVLLMGVVDVGGVILVVGGGCE